MKQNFTILIPVFILLVLGSFFLSACGIIQWRETFPNNPIDSSQFLSSYDSNGERIYFTATNDQGERIPYSGGPAFGGGMMMGTSVTCASCHGADGRGGVHTMHMQVMDAPDIRYDVLISEGEEHGDDGHTDDHNEYGLDEFRRAVVDGEHPDGESLNQDMPRWSLDDDDLADLFEFIKSLP